MEHGITRSKLIERTGVTRRKLEYLDDMGILSPIERNNGTYNLYDEDAEITIRELQLLEECDFRLAEIKKILALPEAERIETIQEQIPVLEEKIRHLNNVIIFARSLSLSGNTGAMFFLDMGEPFDIDSIIHDIYKCYDGSPRFDSINKLIHSIPKDQWRIIWKDCDTIVRKYAGFIRDYPKDTSVKREELEKDIRDFISRYLFDCHSYDLVIIIMWIDKYPSIAKHLDKIGGSGCSKNIRKILQDCLNDCVSNIDKAGEETVVEKALNILEGLFVKNNLPDDISSFEKIDLDDPMLQEFIAGIEKKIYDHSSIFDLISAYNLMTYYLKGIVRTDDDDEEKESFEIITGFFKKAITHYLSERSNQDGPIQPQKTE